MQPTKPTRWAVLLGLLLTVVAVPSIAGVPWLDSGIRGRVLFQANRVLQFPINAPILSPAISYVPPPIPMNASFRVYAARSGKLITTGKTDSHGRFTVLLPAGAYRLVPDTFWRGRALQPGEIVVGPYRAAAPLEVIVPKHRFTVITVTYREVMGF